MPQVRKASVPKPKPSAPKPKPSVPKPRCRKPQTEIETWTVEEFEQKRKHLTDFVRVNICPLIENQENSFIFRAPVKSGKRNVVEYLSVIDKESGKKRVHAFVSTWHRKADCEQREELKGYHIEVFSLTTDKIVCIFLKWIQDNLDAGNLIVVHLDECDYGSGEKQLLSKIWPKIRCVPCITSILYSATPEEALFSNEFMKGHPPIFYTPPPGYCGPGMFLEAGLVHDALPFFTEDGLSEQAKEILRDMHAARQTNPKRNIFILRLTGLDSKHKFLASLPSFKELSEFTVIIDKDEEDCDIQSEDIKWSSKRYWDTKGTDKPLLVVHNQTATRSTEWSCHDRVFATHDYRKTVTYVVVSQAQERVNHYEAKYGGFQPIRVYGHEDSFLLSAGKIKHIEYEAKVSNRTKKTVKDEEAVECFFVPCNKDDDIDGLVQKEFTRLDFEVTRTFDNEKFINSEKKGMVDGKYQGNFRVWKVFDYQEVLKEKNAGLNDDTPIRSIVCYNEGVLGLGFRFLTGEIIKKNTIKSHLSVFK